MPAQFLSIGGTDVDTLATLQRMTGLEPAGTVFDFPAAPGRAGVVDHGETLRPQAHRFTAYFSIVGLDEADVVGRWQQMIALAKGTAFGALTVERVTLTVVMGARTGTAQAVFLGGSSAEPEWQSHRHCRFALEWIIPAGGFTWT